MTNRCYEQNDSTARNIPYCHTCWPSLSLSCKERSVKMMILWPLNIIDLSNLYLKSKPCWYSAHPPCSGLQVLIKKAKHVKENMLDSVMIGYWKYTFYSSTQLSKRCSKPWAVTVSISVHLLEIKLHYFVLAKRMCHLRKDIA